MRKMNDSAQWQMMEVVLVAGMLFAAMYLVRSSNVTVYKSIEEENPLQAQGYEALESIAVQPPLSGDQHNLLAYYIDYFNENGDDGGLTDGIKKYFSSDINCKITMIDITKSKEESKPLEECTTIIYDPLYWIEEESCSANRVVTVYDDEMGRVYVYEIILSLWYNTGG